MQRSGAIKRFFHSDTVEELEAIGNIGLVLPDRFFGMAMIAWRADMRRVARNSAAKAKRLSQS